MSSRRSRRGLTKRPHPPRLQSIEPVSFNEMLKELDRRGQLEAFMERWIAFERERERIRA